jgi:hypothetical protein
MADDAFDPKEFAASKPPPEFDPTEFAAARPTGRERQREYLQSVREGSTSTPAGQEASGPDLSAERGTAGGIAGEYGDIAKGVAKGVPAAIVGGITGDVESLGRGTINAFLPKDKQLSHDTFFPTTTEGGAFGPKSLGTSALMNPAANPREAFGMGVGSALAFGPKIMRAVSPRVEPALPPGSPPGDFTPIPRQNGSRLLTPDVQHHAKLPEGTSAGAASRGPLTDVSPEAVDILREQFKPYSPWVVGTRAEEMSPHQSLAEFNYETQRLARGLTGKSGEAAEEIGNFHGQRIKEAKDRTRSLLDDTLGEAPDLAQERRILEIDQRKAADPLYQQFKAMRIPPTEQLMGLLPRLENAGAFSEARALAGVKGIPWDAESFSNYGPFGDIKRMPTAETWDLVKQALDSKIEASLGDFGKPTKWTRAYVDLKNSLVNAIDNHSNPQVAGVWKQARETYMKPAEVMDAQRFGQKILKSSVDADELRFMTAGYDDAKMNGLMQGVRKSIEDQLRGPGNKTRQVINNLLSENGVLKLQSVVRDEGKLNNLIAGLEHERDMMDASQMITGRSNSHTTPYREDIDAVEQMMASRTAPIVGLAHDIKDMGVTRTAGKYATGIFEKMSEAKRAKTRADIARIMTLQGPERDAVLRYLTQPEHKDGGRVISRATGGRAVSQSSRPLLKDARKAPDGKYYIPDKSRPGKYLRVDT